MRLQIGIWLRSYSDSTFSHYFSSIFVCLLALVFKLVPFFLIMFIFIHHLLLLSVIISHSSLHQFQQQSSCVEICQYNATVDYGGRGFGACFLGDECDAKRSVRMGRIGHMSSVYSTIFLEFTCHDGNKTNRHPTTSLPQLWPRRLR